MINIAFSTGEKEAAQTVSILGVRKSFGVTPVLQDVTLEIAAGEFLTLLGPSGCGKSTLLRIIAGLELQDMGTIIIGGKIVDTLRPKRRDVAMVFQSYALYPHLTVAQNISLPLKMRRLSPWKRLPFVGRFLPGTSSVMAEIRAETVRIAKALGLELLLDRKPGQLSGGQRQRVAVGRAMVRRPAVFLMDEPLSNLDAKLRVQMRAELKELHRRLGVTFIYVTHDQSEAMTLSDRVAVMLNGKLLQVAPPQEIYADPNDRRVAEFIGSPKINMLDATVREDGLVDIAGSVLPIGISGLADTSLTLGIRSESFYLAEHDEPGVLTGTVKLVEHMGSDLYVYLTISDVAEPVVVRLVVEQASNISVGQVLHIGVQFDKILIFASTGERIYPGIFPAYLSPSPRVATITPIRECLP